MTLEYPDLSQYTPASVAGAAVVFARASIGTARDSFWPSVVADAAARNVRLGGYHFLNAGSLGASAAAQADFAAGEIGGRPAMLDWEPNRGACASMGEACTWVDEFRARGGVVRLVYFPHWVWQQLGSPSLQPLVDRGLRLVSSDYTTYTDAGPGWAPYGGMAPAVWQFTDAHPFNGYMVDMNAYRGSVDEFWQLATGRSPAVVTPTEDTMPAPLTANVPAGFAFDLDAQGVPQLVDASKLLTLNLPAGSQAGLPWGAEYVSVAADLLGNPSPRLRVAVSDGKSWSLDTNFQLTSGQRRNIGPNGALPPPASPSAYVVSIGRIRQSPPKADGSETDPTGPIPVSVLAELGAR